jgi:hypothetical protein
MTMCPAADAQAGDLDIISSVPAQPNFKGQSSSEASSQAERIGRQQPLETRLADAFQRYGRSEASVIEVEDVQSIVGLSAQQLSSMPWS